MMTYEEVAQLAQNDQLLAEARELARTVEDPKVRNVVDLLVETLTSARTNWLAARGVTEPTCGCSLFDALVGKACSEAMTNAAVA